MRCFFLYAIMTARVLFKVVWMMFGLGALKVPGEILFTNLASFDGVNGNHPLGGLVQGADGAVYGVANNGGMSGDNGTIYRVDPGGKIRLLVSFDGTNGSGPVATLILGTDGYFYGTTYSDFILGGGTVFKMQTNGTLTTVYRFSGGNDGGGPWGGVIQGSDGNLYGTTSYGGANNFGTVFKLTTNGVLGTLASLNGSNGAAPYARLIQAADGNFYGTTREGGSGGKGTIFKITSAGILTTIFSFNGANGESPLAGLIQGGDGNFYGTTSSGGTNALPYSSDGTLFRVTPAGLFTSLLSFNRTNGSSPDAALIEIGSDLYGVTQSGGLNGRGTIFDLSADGVLTTLFSFNLTNGATPQAELLHAADGQLYGTTSFGGTSNSGSLFRFEIPAMPVPIQQVYRTSRSNTFTLLYSFGGVDGSSPAGLLQASDGNFYGITESGGSNNVGTIFRISPQGSFTTVVTFNSTNGAYPSHGVIQALDGKIYGTTVRGGVEGHGTLFQIDTNGVFVSLVSFTTNSPFPVGKLLQSSDGSLYGTTAPGDSYNFGTVFQRRPDGTLSLLHTFAGSQPVSGVILGEDGNLYGTTVDGGLGFGTLFRLNPNGAFTSLYSFTGGNDGREPYTLLVQGFDKGLYGTTRQGGDLSQNGGLGFGTVFKITTNGDLTTLLRFSGTNGSFPTHGLTPGADGRLYGSTSKGGDLAQNFGYGSGTIFRITGDGVFETLYVFRSVANGAEPGFAPIFGKNGYLYGSTESGGANGLGTVFRIAPDNLIGFSWSALVGRSYQTQVRNDLTPANWNNAGPSVLATNSTASTVDFIQAGGQKFYRVTLLP